MASNTDWNRVLQNHDELWRQLLSIGTSTAHVCTPTQTQNKRNDEVDLVALVLARTERSTAVGYADGRHRIIAAATLT